MLLRNQAPWVAQTVGFRPTRPGFLHTACASHVHYLRMTSMARNSPLAALDVILTRSGRIPRSRAATPRARTAPAVERRQRLEAYGAPAPEGSLRGVLHFVQDDVKGSYGTTPFGSRKRAAIGRPARFLARNARIARAHTQRDVKSGAGARAALTGSATE